MLLRGLKQQLTDGVELLDDLKESHGQVYDPLKKAQGLSWDPTADRRSKRAFQELIVVACSSLDIIAEVTALMFTGRIPGLTVGRAQFVSVEDWLRQPPQPSGVLLTPQDAGIADLHAALAPLVFPTGSECDWVPLVRMLRNKGAHLGDEVFRYFGLHDSDGRLYLFVPREWPYFFEQDIRPAGDKAKKSIAELLLKTLIHEDYISFAEGLNTKVRVVVGAAWKVFRSAYTMFGAFDFNELAIKELKKNSCSYGFKHFESMDGKT